jgi:hypothetical protein
MIEIPKENVKAANADLVDGAVVMRSTAAGIDRTKHHECNTPLNRGLSTAL